MFNALLFQALLEFPISLLPFCNKQPISSSISYNNYLNFLTAFIIPFIVSINFSCIYFTSHVQEISLLREKYKNNIEIKIGFEMEYYCDFFDKMLSDAIDFGAEYLIFQTK